MLYDEYPWEWSDPYVRFATAAIAGLIVLSLILFIICKYQSRRLDNRMNIIVSFNNEKNEQYGNDIHIDERYDGSVLHTDRQTTQGAPSFIGSFNELAKTKKNKRREYQDVNTSEDDSLKSSSGDDNQMAYQYTDIRDSEQQQNIMYGINRGSSQMATSTQGSQWRWLKTSLLLI